jgi:hypothetical protein
MERDVRAVLVRAGWRDGEYAVARRGDDVLVALGLDLVESSPANGGNAAGAMVTSLRTAGFEVTPGNWEHLLAGEESVVTRYAYTTPALARALYGPSPSHAQLRAAAQWAERRTAPLNRGSSPLLWPAGVMDAALAERAELHASGRVNPGNRTSGEGRRGSRPAACNPPG